MGFFSSKKSSDGGRDRSRDQGEEKWSFWSSGHRPSGKAVVREQQRQNPNGFRKSGKW